MKVLRKELKLRGYTIKSLADEINKSPANIYCWLRGDTHPNADSVKKLKRLGFSDAAVLEPDKEVEV